MNNELDEKLLESWLKVYSAIWNNRILEDTLSYNEAIVCNLLYKEKKNNSERPYLPIKSLCEHTKLLKSQMNKTLNDLEKRGFIQRHRFNEDRRMVYISLCESGEKVYLESHKTTMEFVNKVASIMGKELVINATNSFIKVAEIVNEVISKGNK